MANNEHINKVVKSTGETLMDLTSDTVTPETLLQDVTAHDRSGAQITGTVIVAPTDVTETEDNTAYLYKNSEHDAVYDELVGGSVAWNQLVANSGSSLSVTITSGHKYVIKKSGTLSVGASSGSAITGLTGGTDWITDLTLMFGTAIADYVYTLEQSTAGSGIAWLKSYGFFTKDYYAYNAGVLVSVNVSGKKVVSETTEIIYPIQSTDLRGLYKLSGNKLYTDGDIYSADGQITRKYGIVDLGTLNWYVYADSNRFFANVEQGSTRITNALCSKYVVTNTGFSSLKDKEMNYGQPVVGYGWRGVGVRDSDYTDTATFKAAMSGVYLIYELATPTTETSQPFTSPQIVYRSGTEEYLDTRDVPIPVGGNRKYVDIPDWMVNEYFDDVRAKTSTALSLAGGTMTGILEWGDGVGGIAYAPSSYDLQIYNQLADYGRITISSAGKLELEGHNEVKLQISGGNFVMGEHLFYMNLPDENSENLQILRMTYGGGSELVIDGSGHVGKSSSSRDIKHDIQYIENTESYHDALMRIKPATYVYNNDKTETAKLGMIAEDIADVMPIAALTGEGGKVENYDTRAIIAMLVMEVQRLNAEIERLRGDSNAD